MMAGASSRSHSPFGQADAELRELESQEL